MSKYHKYVFDTENRIFIGDFEAMYQNEQVENFDAWHQEDTRQLQRKTMLSIYEAYNFNTVLDIGCGKGSLTHLLKKRNNRVLAIDISQTAINIATERYPDIEFYAIDIANLKEIEIFLSNIKTDVVILSEVLSYIENWPAVIALLSTYCRHILLSLYIPDNPIGYVKSQQSLVEVVGKYFSFNEIIDFKQTQFTVIFAKSHYAI